MSIHSGNKRNLGKWPQYLTKHRILQRCAFLYNRENWTSSGSNKWKDNKGNKLNYDLGKEQDIWRLFKQQANDFSLNNFAYFKDIVKKRRDFERKQIY